MNKPKNREEQARDMVCGDNTGCEQRLDPKSLTPMCSAELFHTATCHRRTRAIIAALEAEEHKLKSTIHRLYIRIDTLAAVLASIAQVAEAQEQAGDDCLTLTFSGSYMRSIRVALANESKEADEPIIDSHAPWCDRKSGHSGACSGPKRVPTEPLENIHGILDGLQSHVTPNEFGVRLMFALRNLATRVAGPYSEAVKVIENTIDPECPECATHDKYCGKC